MSIKKINRFNFSKAILNWFDVHGRKDLPWQINPSPYRVWISEIMLQQTQVNTAIPYYLRFMDSFPDIHSLSSILSHLPRPTGLCIIGQDWVIMREQETCTKQAKLCNKNTTV